MLHKRKIANVPNVASLNAAFTLRTTVVGQS